jgi:hypothetical protein
MDQVIESLPQNARGSGFNPSLVLAVFALKIAMNYLFYDQKVMQKSKNSFEALPFSHPSSFLMLVSSLSNKLPVSKSNDKDLQSHWGRFVARLGFPRAHLSHGFTE